MSSVAGALRITQRYYACHVCKQTASPRDVRADVGADHLTPQTRRTAALAGSSLPCDVAAERLLQLCELRISADVIRKVTEPNASPACAACPTATNGMHSGAMTPGKHHNRAVDPFFNSGRFPPWSLPTSRVEWADPACPLRTFR